ncbi:hypothetical protein [Phytomonospora endophytica]|uniref:Uncharacterized protein n=1 Tax=Phytomonospora endophytica TaxID=714109 RepID=A0A841FKG1_9ACTN|nr:hypothetical protein [Phytomonospora endophytica]MBB6037821.1 hypothetical protein [Phytomonospora endophytica]
MILAGTLIVVGIVLTGLSAVQLGIARAAAKWPSARRPRLGRGPALVGITTGVLFAGAAGALAATLVPTEGLMWTLGVAGAGVLVSAVATGIAAKLASQVELKALISTPSPAYIAITPRGEAPPMIAARSDNMAAPPAQPATIATSGATNDSGSLPGAHNTSPPTQPVAYATPRHDHIRPWDEPELAVPTDAEPGWVYQDGDGNYLLVVDIDTPEDEGRRLVRLVDFALAPYGSVREPLRLAGSIEISVWPME